jgi:glycosyltransferase involved in cell wall biosynthesis
MAKLTVMAFVTKIKPKVMNNPDYKFETYLFWKSEKQGGMRKKGFFKHSYIKEGKTWFICDTDSQKSRPAPPKIQFEIENYIKENNWGFERLPLVSCVMASKNSEKSIRRAIESVKNQTYPNIEIIVVDGESEDKTIEILESSDVDYWISEKDNGIYDALNKGVMLSCGEWIFFLGSDDFILPYAIEKYLRLILEKEKITNQKIDFASSKMMIVWEAKIWKFKDKIEEIYGKEWKWEEFKRWMTVAHPGSLHRRDLFKEIGLFDTNYKIAGDYELLLRKKSELRTAFLDDITVIMSGEGISRRKPLVGLTEAERAKIKTAGINPKIAKIEKYIMFGRFLLGRVKRIFQKQIKKISPAR